MFILTRPELLNAPIRWDGKNYNVGNHLLKQGNTENPMYAKEELTALASHSNDYIGYKDERPAKSHTPVRKT